MQNIASNGFKLGLHFDPMIYANIPEYDLFRAVKDMAKLLSKVSVVKISSVSLHNSSVHNKYPSFPGFINAYNTELFSDSNYLSDSSMNFRGKNPYSFVQKARNTPLQVVLHLMHYCKISTNYLGIFQRYLVEVASDIDVNYSVKQTYLSNLKGRSIFDVLIPEYLED